MRTAIVEATNGFNWGKFLIGRLDDEWDVPSAVASGTVLRQTGFDPRAVLVLDLQTTEGAFFHIGGLASADLTKHRIWVCPMFEPFLAWLYRQDLADLDELPALVELDAPAEMQGYRRPGPG